MPIEKIIILFLCFLILTMSYIAKIKTKTWLNPSSILNNFWFVYIFFPTLFALNEPIFVLPIIYIFIFNLFFTSSLFLFKWNFKGSLFNKNLNFFYTLSNKNYILVLAVFTSVLVIISSLQSSNIPFELMYSDPMKFASIYSGLNYDGRIEPSIIFRFGLLFNYLVPIFGGISFYFHQKFTQIILSLLPSFIILIFHSQKGMIFFSFFLFLGSYLYCSYIIKSSRKNIIIGKLFVLFLIMFVLLCISFISRGMSFESDNDAIISRIIEFSLSYSSGHLYAFSYWFTQYYDYLLDLNFMTELNGIGFYTFLFIYDFLGLAINIPTGVYNEYYNGLLVTTNIYTIHRGLLSDFGIFGSLIFSTFLGFFLNYIFYRVNIGKSNSLHFIIYCFMFGIIYQSFIISSFTWLLTPVAIIFTSVVFYLINELKTYEKK